MYTFPRYPMALAGLLAAAVVLTAGTPAAFADDLSEQGRAVLDEHREAVVTLIMVISVSYEGNESENETEANATVISPDGLAVLSLTAVDPTVQYERSPDMTSDLVSKIKDMRMVLADGSEITAEVVLRDRDLDLAFVRPVSPVSEPMSHVDLTRTSAPQILDPVVVLAQLGKVSRRAHSAFIERVETLVERPRLFYVLGQHRGQSVMCSPVFGLDGGFVGIGVLRTLRAAQGGRFEEALVIVVPAEDIRTASEQAPAPGEGAAEESPAEAPPEEPAESAV